MLRSFNELDPAGPAFISKQVRSFLTGLPSEDVADARWAKQP
jgi:hypothetical protein